jgi:hypothetical protein
MFRQPERSGRTRKLTPPALNPAHHTIAPCLCGSAVKSLISHIGSKPRLVGSKLRLIQAPLGRNSREKNIFLKISALKRI